MCFFTLLTSLSILNCSYVNINHPQYITPKRLHNMNGYEWRIINKKITKGACYGVKSLLYAPVSNLITLFLRLVILDRTLRFMNNFKTYNICLKMP